VGYLIRILLKMNTHKQLFHYSKDTLHYKQLQGHNFLDNYLHAVKGLFAVARQQ
jgi:hypothetical protein